MINVQTLYQKVLKEEVDKDQFLFQVRRDGRFPFVTNVSSFNDTVKQLKNRGYIQEAKASKSEDEDFNLMESIHQFGMETKEKEKNPRDYINDYEFQKGWRYEFDKQKEKNVEKAQSAAIKNLQKDDLFYTRLEAGEKKPGKRVDQPVEVKKDNFVDKDNRVKPAKGANKEQNKANVSKKKDPKASKNPKGVKHLKEAIIAIAQLMKETDKKKVEEDFSVDKEGKLNSPAPKITDIGISQLRKDYGGGYSISGKVNGEKRIQKLSKEDVQKGFNLPKKELAALIKKYLVDNFDEKVDKFLKGKADVRNQFAKADPSLNESLFDSPEKQYKGKEVSFTVQDKDDPNKKVRITKVVKAGKKNKNGSFEIAFASGDRISITKGKQGISSLYFEDPQKPSDYDKVVDIDQSLSKLTDKIFPKEQEKQVAEGIINEELSIKPHIYPFSIEKLKALKQRGDEILHFNQGTYGRVTLLVSAEEKNRYSSSGHDFSGSGKKTRSSSDPLKLIAKFFRQKNSQDIILDLRQVDVMKLSDEITKQSIGEGMNVNKKGKLKDTELQDFLDDVDGKIPVVVIDSEETPEKYSDFNSAEQKHPDLKDNDRWYASLSDKKLYFISLQVANEHQLKESIKNIIRKKLNENQEPGPTVKKQELEHLMKNYDWYFEKSDDRFLKDKGQETHDKAMKLVGELGEEGVKVFNDYAPDDCKITHVNETMSIVSKDTAFDPKPLLQYMKNKEGQDSDIFYNIETIIKKNGGENKRVSEKILDKIIVMMKNWGFYDKYKDYLNVSVN